MMGRCKPYLGKVDSCIFELISTVQAYPSLYNKADPGYKKSRSNNVIWEAIGFLMKQDAKWCKTNWLYYQEEFRRNSKAIQPYHKALLFLNDFNDSETTARATKIIVHVETTPHWFENVGTDVEIIFKINKNTKMRKIMKGFYDRVGVPLHKCRFLYCGRRVNDDDTPELLKMDLEDVIDVFYEQIG